MDRNRLSEFIQSQLEGTGYFLTDLKFGADDTIVVEIDSMQSVDIDECIALTRAIEQEFPREEEDYNLEVGSAGLTSPLRVPAQYRKHVGHDMEVLTADGRKLHGLMIEADDEGFTIEREEKVKVEGQKKPVLQAVKEHFPYSAVKRVVWDLKF